MYTVNDTLLLQLQAIFGPMLMSALQLVDRREGVLPGLNVLVSWLILEQSSRSRFRLDGPCTKCVDHLQTTRVFSHPVDSKMCHSDLG